MDRIEIYQEIRSMQIAYSFHFVFYIILGVEHILIILKIFWNNNNIKKIFLSCSIIDLVILFYPIIPLILMYRIILKKYLTKLFKILSLIIIIMSIILGIIITVSFWLNLKSTTDFYKECPFNLPIEQEINESKCKNRICILNFEDLDNKYPYEYLCNYNPSKYFEGNEGPFRRKKNDNTEIVSDNEIICNKYEFKVYIFQNKIINKYLNICNYVEEFYICQRFLKPQKFYIENNYECPNDNYFNGIYIFCILNIFFNLIISFAPWKLELNFYAKIINRFRVNNNRISNSFKSTKNSSKIAEQNGEDNFKKEPTDLIIFPNNNKNLNENINNIENNDNDNNIDIYIYQINPNSRKVNLKKDNNTTIIEETDRGKENNKKIYNPQNSADIFILDNNRAIKKLKKKK